MYIMRVKKRTAYMEYFLIGEPQRQRSAITIQSEQTPFPSLIHSRTCMHLLPSVSLKKKKKPPSHTPHLPKIERKSENEKKKNLHPPSEESPKTAFLKLSGSPPCDSSSHQNVFIYQVVHHDRLYQNHLVHDNHLVLVLHHSQQEHLHADEAPAYPHVPSLSQ